MNTHYKNTSKPILEKIGANHYKLYKEGATFFLTDEKDNYLGNIELEKVNKYHQIRASHSKLPRGFYNIMFTSILSTEKSTGIKEIISDFGVSPSAISSYEKLTVNGLLNIRILSHGNYLPFSKEEFLKDKNNVVSVTSKTNLKEHFEDFHKRITMIDKETGLPLAYNRMYNSYDPNCDNFLFCENFKE